MYRVLAGLETRGGCWSPGVGHMFLISLGPLALASQAPGPVLGSIQYLITRCNGDQLPLRP